MLDQILAIISPHSCKGCGQVGSPLCGRCTFNIIEDKKSSTQKDFYSVGLRHGVLKELTDDYKFKSEREISKVFTELLDRIVPQLPKDTVVVPIPTASAHIRQYGFDHMGLLARRFAKRRQLMYSSLLLRTNNQTQHFLGKRERERAAKAALGLRAGARVPDRVLLLDDVVTTGATLRAARTLLRGAGVKKITIATICYQNKNGVQLAYV
jgi:ComF family protein